MVADSGGGVTPNMATRPFIVDPPGQAWTPRRAVDPTDRPHPRRRAALGPHSWSDRRPTGQVVGWRADGRDPGARTPPLSRAPRPGSWVG